MRIIGIILVLLGALSLASVRLPGVFTIADNSQETAANAEAGQSVPRIPPVFSGIALVSGLILLASSGRRDEA